MRIIVTDEYEKHVRSMHEREMAVLEADPSSEDRENWEALVAEMGVYEGETLDQSVHGRDRAFGYMPEGVHCPWVDVPVKPPKEDTLDPTSIFDITSPLYVSLAEYIGALGIDWEGRSR